MHQLGASAYKHAPSLRMTYPIAFTNTLS